MGKQPRKRKYTPNSEIKPRWSNEKLREMFGDSKADRSPGAGRRPDVSASCKPSETQDQRRGTEPQARSEILPPDD